MTTREFLELAGRYPGVLAAVFLAPPVLAWLLGRLHARGAGGAAPWRYGYAGLVYAACVPGMFAAVITGYGLFFTHENLLDANVLVYLLPVASMVVTLILVRKNVAFAEVPGFERLSGLMVMVGCSFGVALAVQKTAIWLVFGGSIVLLFVLAGGVFALLKWGTHMLFRRRDEPKAERPKFPGG